MSKLYALLTVVLPILVVVGLIQLILLIVRAHLRARVNFVIFGVLAFASIRPNLLGETFGIIGPFYFFILLKLSKSLNPEFQVNSKIFTKARSTLFGMYLILFSYWCYVGFISSLNNYDFNAWPPIANLGTIALDSYFLLQIFKNGCAPRLMEVFIMTVSFQAGACLFSKYLLSYNYCLPFNIGRGWDYSLCAPGAIYSLGTRLTGFGGEPSIFATYLSLTLVMVWWPQFKFNVYQSLFVSSVCAWASLVSKSTTGITLIMLAILLIPFQRITLRKGPFILVSYSAVAYYLLSTNIVQRTFDRIITDKLKSNSGSITDRSLNLTLTDYLTRWTEYPFGHAWGIYGDKFARSINLLADSLQFGPIVILLMILLMCLAILYSREPVQLTSACILIFTTCLLLQPTWLNSIWFILIYSNFLAIQEKSISTVTQLSK